MSEMNDNLEQQNYRKWIRYAITGVLLSVMAGTLAVRLTRDHFSFEELRVFHAPVLALLTTMVVTAWVCNGFRTWLLSKIVGFPISLRRSIGITLSMEFAIAATPAGIGGMVTRIGLQKKEGMSYEKSTALMSADWIADLLFFVVLAPFGIWQLVDLIPSGFWNFPGDWRIELGVLLSAATMLILAIRYRGFIVSRLPASVRNRLTRLKETLSERRQRHWEELCTCARMIVSGHRWSYFMVCLIAAVQWICRYGILVVILWNLNHSVQPIVLMLIQGSLFMLGLFIVIPGGGGSVEILTSIALTPLVGIQTATLAVVIWRFFTYYLYLIGGGTVFLVNIRKLLRIPEVRVAQ